MNEFRLVDQLDIDDGELDHLDRNKCFVLGVEWQAFREKIKTRKRHLVDIHSENEGRLMKLAEKHRYYFMKILVNDAWTTLDLWPMEALHRKDAE